MPYSSAEQSGVMLPGNNEEIGRTRVDGLYEIGQQRPL